MLALVDCNNFYASCERLFRPALRGQPIVVLSNNDGCVVARSDEAKAAGVEMGVPLFEIKDLIRKAGIHVFSSNYALYGDLSERVVTVLRQGCPHIEVYSIDESFCDLSGVADPLAWGQDMRARILQCVGMPVCVGVAPTKTLAKVANRVAKKFKERTGGVHVLDRPELHEKALRWTAIGDVWGVGRALSRKLQAEGIRSAWDFSQRPQSWVRKNFGVVLARTWLELNGTACMDLQDVEPERKSLRTSRSFEKCLTDRIALEEAVATFASRTAAKLRSRELCATAISVFMVTNRFDAQAKQFYGRQTGPLLVPTGNTHEIVERALELARRAWRDGYGYKKAGVEALDLVPRQSVQTHLFDTQDRGKLARLQSSMDGIARKWGAESLGLAVQGREGRWSLRREHLSKRYTTSWDELLEIDMDRCALRA